MTEITTLTLDTEALNKAAGYARVEADATCLAEFLSFSSRETYLAWVASWKVALHVTIADVRDARKTRSDKSLDIHSRNSAQAYRQYLRVVGHNLMSLRRAGKTEAKRQVEAARCSMAA